MPIILHKYHYSCSHLAQSHSLPFLQVFSYCYASYSNFICVYSGSLDELEHFSVLLLVGANLAVAIEVANTVSELIAAANFG